MAARAPRPLLVLPLILAAACAAPSKAQRVQETADEFNMGTRFNRSELVLPQVAESARERFLTQHRKWANEVRIVDLDFIGLTVHDDNADVFLSIGWQRANDPDMNTTVVRQVWHDFRGTWMLMKEERSQGDYGLLGDSGPTDAAPRAARSDRAFRTMVIRLARADRGGPRTLRAPP